VAGPLQERGEEPAAAADVELQQHLLHMVPDRALPGDGRTYTISFTATDASGNASTVTAEVVVPHDKP